MMSREGDEGQGCTPAQPASFANLLISSPRVPCLDYTTTTAVGQGIFRDPGIFHREHSMSPREAGLTFGYYRWHKFSVRFQRMGSSSRARSTKTGSRAQFWPACLTCRRSAAGVRQASQRRRQSQTGTRSRVSEEHGGSRQAMSSGQGGARSVETRRPCRPEPAI